MKKTQELQEKVEELRAELASAEAELAAAERLETAWAGSLTSVMEAARAAAKACSDAGMTPAQLTPEILLGFFFRAGKEEGE